MALRPGASGMFLCAVEDGVTRRTCTKGRLSTTAWVAVGRRLRASTTGWWGTPPRDTGATGGLLVEPGPAAAAGAPGRPYGATGGREVRASGEAGACAAGRAAGGRTKGG